MSPKLISLGVIVIVLWIMMMIVAPRKTGPTTQPTLETLPAALHNTCLIEQRVTGTLGRRRVHQRQAARGAPTEADATINLSVVMQAADLPESPLAAAAALPCGRSCWLPGWCTRVLRQVWQAKEFVSTLARRPI